MTKNTFVIINGTPMGQGHITGADNVAGNYYHGDKVGGGGPRSTAPQVVNYGQDVIQGNYINQQGDPDEWRAKLHDDGTVDGVGLVKGEVRVGGVVIRKSLAALAAEQEQTDQP